MPFGFGERSFPLTVRKGERILVSRDNQIRIGLIGTYEPDKSSHQATLQALAHAGAGLGLDLEISWLSSGSLAGEGGVSGLAASFQGLFAPPGKAYAHPPGALAAIRFCREQRRPFFGT